MFYCINCDTNFCEDCEKRLGYNHRHCYYKIKNIKQYEEVLDVKIDEWNKNTYSFFKAGIFATGTAEKITTIFIATFNTRSYRIINSHNYYNYKKY